MSSYRWTTHRFYDGTGVDRVGKAPISMWWLARAAAEETLQGSPLAAAWLKLFRTQLSSSDTYWLRWRGDLAESAELRRAYSGLYGRFFARAMLGNHLGLTRFLSLKRNGISVPGSVAVTRSSKGDIPDWLAWDNSKSLFVLCEAKGSLTSNDFLVAAGPKCIRDGKKQFGRVEAKIGGKIIKPDEWVSATRWATEDRAGGPVTVLWDPPVDQKPFSEKEAEVHRAAMSRAWLNSIAPALGWQNADQLIADERTDDAIIVTAAPGPIPEDEDWPRLSDDTDGALPTDDNSIQNTVLYSTEVIAQTAQPFSDLLTSDVYQGRAILDLPKTQPSAHTQPYLSALITPFGVRPIRTQLDYENALLEQKRSRSLEQPAMLVGIPLGINPGSRREGQTWIDGAGISSPDELAVFDLRRIELKPAGTFRQ